MTKYHLVAVGVGLLIGVAFADKIKSLPLVNKLPL
jgi:hypothetical protein